MRGSVDAKHLRGPRPPLSVIRERRRFVTAGQDGVVQIRHVGLSGIKRYDHSLTLCIYPDVAHTRDAHERFSQFADAFIAIFAFCRDRDSLQHRFIRAVRVMRVRWIEMLRIKWFDHPSVYAPLALCHPERSEGPRRWFAISESRTVIVVRACLRAISLSPVKRCPSLCDFGLQSEVPRLRSG